MARASFMIQDIIIHNDLVFGVVVYVPGYGHYIFKDMTERQKESIRQAVDYCPACPREIYDVIYSK